MGKAHMIGIPLGTRLTGLVLVDGEVHIWTGNRVKGGVYANWQGVYIRVEPNGRVTHIVKDTECDPRYISDFVIKEADNE